MNTAHDLPEGMYLIGRLDGLVTPFFVRITDGESGRHFKADVTDRFLIKIVSHPREWWWCPKFPDTLPSDTELAAMPCHFKELP